MNETAESFEISRSVRADARRNIEALLASALRLFTVSGVDAPIKDIAAHAGVGIGTLYRHFPRRSDLIKAVVKHEVDACVEAAVSLSDEHPPVDALTLWMERYVEMIMAKRGLAAALHSGDPAYEALPAYFLDRVTPALQCLLGSAAAMGGIRSDIAAHELLSAAMQLSLAPDASAAEQAKRMVGLLLDGLRFGAQRAS